MKNNGCVGCHQMGQAVDAHVLPQGLGEYSSHARGLGEAHAGRTVRGAHGEHPAGQLSGTPIKYFADWTERVEKGELPKSKPTRPQGVERNIVVTTWDMGEPDRYLHDLISSDRRNPTINANGRSSARPRTLRPRPDPRSGHARRVVGA